ncbi:MAG: hypothetical protein LBD08_08305 [Treponema sp.]|jgi:hypothetical protein|nr:hypothetical protein [Treponema sp.]
MDLTAIRGILSIVSLFIILPGMFLTFMYKKEKRKDEIKKLELQKEILALEIQKEDKKIMLLQEENKKLDQIINKK